MTKGLEEWVDQLTKRDMPVLASVVQELNRLTGEEDTEVNQLAEVILRDGNLTTQVLKIANSVRYNPSSYPINTVSRAIVAIGFRGVRAICISVIMIESLLGKSPKNPLLEQMAQSFHAGVQARDLISEIDGEAGEEVFIAALLYHIGKMAFWSGAGSERDKLEVLMTNTDEAEQEKMEKELLGCTFKSLTRALASHWSLGETLEHALVPSESPPPKIAAVCLGEEISRAALKGWESDEFKEIVSKAAQFTGKSYVDSEKQIKNLCRGGSGAGIGIWRTRNLSSDSRAKNRNRRCSSGKEETEANGAKPGDTTQCATGIIWWCFGSDGRQLCFSGSTGGDAPGYRSGASGSRAQFEG